MRSVACPRARARRAGPQGAGLPAAVLLLVSLGVSACSTPESLEQTAAAKGEAIHDSIDVRSTDEADTVLLLARANAHLIAAGVHDDKDELRAQLDRLLQLRIEGEGGWGWGLSYPWDAYGDGVVNPADTIYSYTTAAAALALLDGYAVLGDEKYLEAARQAGAALTVDTCCWRDGDHVSVWYDDQPNDQRNERQVHNVNGLALAAFTRLDEATGDSRYADLTSAMAEHLIEEQGEGYAQENYGKTRVADSNWAYSQAEPGRPNDLIHEAFIVEGLLTYGTDEAVQAARRSLDGMLATHFNDGEPREGKYTFGSLGWGPGAALFVLAMVDDYRDAARPVAENLSEAVSDEGRSTLADAEQLRAQAWYSLGLARFANEPGLR